MEKLDLVQLYDVDYALRWDIDILFSNAGIANLIQSVNSIDLVRQTFESNVFAPELAQKFVRPSKSPDGELPNHLDNLEYPVLSAARLTGKQGGKA